MQGLMQDQPLLISTIMKHAALYHHDGEIVTRAVEGGIHRITYGEVTRRSARLAHALARLGVGRGDCVSSLAWNSYRHLELYLAVPAMGAVLNTVNPRLFPEQISYILNHSEARVLCLDLTFLPLVEKLRSHFATVEKFIIMTDRAHMPQTSLDNVLCYEDIIAPEADHFDWPELDENTAAGLCYTSGTTGDPKGVLYSHRSTVLHCFSLCARDGLGLGKADSVLPIVPMFHVNAWGIPYAATMCGSKLVFPSAEMTGENFFTLIKEERCTIALGVPTIWLALLQYVATLDKQEYADLPVEHFVIGGSAAAPSLIRSLEKPSTPPFCMPGG